MEEDAVVSSPLQNLVTAGAAAPMSLKRMNLTTKDLLQPKGIQVFHQGWVYDVEHASKKLKQRTLPDLRFTDWKTAWYGVQASGVLQFDIPLSITINHEDTDTATTITTATTVVKRLVICQADDPLEVGGCAFRKDMTFTVNGMMVTTPRWLDSSLVKNVHNQPICLDLLDTPVPVDHTHLNVTAQVTNPRIRWNQGPCSIAHILVETLAKSS
jgi:hypothetical protein